VDATCRRKVACYTYKRPDTDTLDHQIVSIGNDLCQCTHSRELFLVVATPLNHLILCILATSSMAETANTYRVKIDGDIYWYCAVIWVMAYYPANVSLAQSTRNCFKTT
jgi:hypothetical protein